MIQEAEVIYAIPVDQIHADFEWNTREVEGAEYSELKRAIKGDGQQQPGGVVLASAEEEAKFGKKYVLVYGFRRFKVVQDLHIPTYKAVIKEAATNEDRLKLNWSENYGRQELNLWEQTRFLQHRVDEGWTEERIMEEFKLSRSYVQPRVMLAKLSKKHPDLIQLARDGKITQKDIRDLNSLTDFETCAAQVQELKKASELGIKIKVKKAGAKTKRDMNKMLMERTKPMRSALVQWCYSNKIPLTYWFKVIAWTNGGIDNNQLCDVFDDMIHDPRMTDELKDILDDLDAYKDDTGRLYMELAQLKESCQNKTYERPINGFPEK